jgi:Domain of unknown function (DUF4417)
MQQHFFPAMPAGRLDGTRTSGRWPKPPPDPLNLRIMWPQVNQYGIPQLEPGPDEPPSMLTAWHDPGGRAEAAKAGGALHFFLDDYRFEMTWNRPDRALERVRQVGAALTPDYSLWREMPLAVQLWQVYRARWVGAYWQYCGIRVWPTVSWSTPESYGFCFEGLPEGAPVAVSTVGVKDAEGRDLFRAGLTELINRVNPSRLLVYGTTQLELTQTGIPVTAYPSFWDTRKPRKAEALWAVAAVAVEAKAVAVEEGAAAAGFLPGRR